MGDRTEHGDKIHGVVTTKSIFCIALCMNWFNPEFYMLKWWQMILRVVAYFIIMFIPCVCSAVFGELTGKIRNGTKPKWYEAIAEYIACIALTYGLVGTVVTTLCIEYGFDRVIQFFRSMNLL